MLSKVRHNVQKISILLYLNLVYYTDAKSDFYPALNPLTLPISRSSVTSRRKFFWGHFFKIFLSTLVLVFTRGITRLMLESPSLLSLSEFKKKMSNHYIYSYQQKEQHSLRFLMSELHYTLIDPSAPIPTHPVFFFNLFLPK